MTETRPVRGITYTIKVHPDVARDGKAILDSMPGAERERYLGSVRDGTFTLTETYGILAMGEAISRGRERGTRARNVREGLEALS